MKTYKVTLEVRSFVDLLPEDGEAPSFYKLVDLIEEGEAAAYIEGIVEEDTE